MMMMMMIMKKGSRRLWDPTRGVGQQTHQGAAWMICKLDRLVKGEFRRIPEIVGPVTAKTSAFTFVFPYKYSRSMQRVSMAAHLFFWRDVSRNGLWAAKWQAQNGYHTCRVVKVPNFLSWIPVFVFSWCFMVSLLRSNILNILQKFLPVTAMNQLYVLCIDTHGPCMFLMVILRTYGSCMANWKYW